MAEKAVLEDLFLREKPAKIIIGLKTAKGAVYATILSREANCTYSHVIKILNLFQKLGIVTFEKKGRIKRVMLTESGWDIAHTMEALLKKLIQLEEPPAKEEKAQKKQGKK